MKIKNIPNYITVIRLLLIIPIIFSLLAQQYKLAFFVFMLASVSDGVDGYLARRYNWKSHFGAIADPLADKSLMILTYLIMAYLHFLPWWLVAIVISRDLIILLGTLIYRYYIEEPNFGSSLISKCNTALQLLLIIFVLFTAAFPFISLHWINKSINLLIVIVLVTTVISFIDYCWFWGRRAYFLKRKTI